MAPSDFAAVGRRAHDGLAGPPGYEPAVADAIRRRLPSGSPASVSAHRAVTRLPVCRQRRRAHPVRHRFAESLPACSQRARYLARHVDRARQARIDGERFTELVMTELDADVRVESITRDPADRNFEPPFCGLAAPAALTRKSDCVKAAAGRGAEAALTTPSSPRFSALTRPMHASGLAAQHRPLLALNTTSPPAP